MAILPAVLVSTRILCLLDGTPVAELHEAQKEAEEHNQRQWQLAKQTQEEHASQLLELTQSVASWKDCAEQAQRSAHSKQREMEEAAGVLEALEAQLDLLRSRCQALESERAELAATATEARADSARLMATIQQQKADQAKRRKLWQEQVQTLEAEVDSERALSDALRRRCELQQSIAAASPGGPSANPLGIQDDGATYYDAREDGKAHTFDLASAVPNDILSTESINSFTDKSDAMHVLDPVVSPRFITSASMRAEIGIHQYVDRMKEGQKDIYYIHGVTLAQVASQTSLISVLDQGFEVFFIVGPHRHSRACQIQFLESFARDEFHVDTCQLSVHSDTESIPDDIGSECDDGSEGSLGE